MSYDFSVIFLIFQQLYHNPMNNKKKWPNYKPFRHECTSTFCLKKKQIDQIAFITIEFNYKNAELIRKALNSIVLSLTTGEAIIITS